MRLTLRTLLAYLDDHLEPSQAKELGAKIQESPAAAEWVMKIRDVVRKRRLTAPVVSGPGCDLDANLVAEYLDSTLTPDEVVELEGLYHSSDVHLAEVAAAHQILTLVLGEPVDIGPLSRDRMYALGEAAQSTPAAPPPVVTTPFAMEQAVTRAVKPPVVAPAAAPTVGGLAPAVKPVTTARLSSPSIPAVAAPAETKVERKPEDSFDHTIPDYLKAPPLWKRALPAAIVMLVVVWLGMLFTDRTMLTNILGGNPKADSQVVAAGAAEAEAGDAAKEEKPVENAVADANVAKADAEENPDAEKMPEENAAGEQVAVAPAANVDAPPPADLEEPGPTLEAPAKVTPRKTPETDTVPAKPAPAVKEGGKESVAVAKASAKVPDGKPAAATPPPAATRTNPALYVSQDGVVLHYDADRQGWYQLPHRAHVFADDALAVPEPFDAQLQLGREKHRVTVMGPAIMGIVDPTGDLPMGINLLRGRVILQPAEESAPDAAKGAMKTVVSIQGVTWQLELTDPTTRCGIEVIPREPHQFEEDFGTEGWTATLYLWSGTMKVTNAEGMTHSMAGPDSYALTRVSTAADKEKIATSPGELPNWDRRLSTIAQKNARMFSEQFNSDESSARDALLGFVESRVYEHSRLAVACLGLIGDYETMLDVLDRNLHYESRVAAINALRVWVNQTPDNRVKLKTAIEAKFYPQEVETVYRLIWGYSEQDGRNKQTSEQLVDWLEHPRLAVRELAWFYIKSLTNRKEVFDARGTPMHINRAVQGIRKILEKDGTLLPPLPPKAASRDVERKQGAGKLGG